MYEVKIDGIMVLPTLLVPFSFSPHISVIDYFVLVRSLRRPQQCDKSSFTMCWQPFSLMHTCIRFCVFCTSAFCICCCFFLVSTLFDELIHNLPHAANSIFLLSFFAAVEGQQVALVCNACGKIDKPTKNKKPEPLEVHSIEPT